MRLWFAIFVILIQSNTLGAEETVSGVISPLDNDGIYVLTTQVQTTVRWDQTTQVAIKINFRNFKVANNRISYTIHSSEIKQEILLPKKEAYAKFERTQFNPSEIKSSYLTPRGMKLHFTPMADHVPTAAENYFAGKVDLEAKTCTIGKKTYQIRMPSGQTDVLIYDVWGVKDCQPFVNRATAIGQSQGKSFIAREIHLEPLGDQTQRDDPHLPRYLFIGDSISGNYNQSLRAALAGRLIYIIHPPTADPAAKG